jgi:hypothetical protein
MTVTEVKRRRSKRQ